MRHHVILIAGLGSSIPFLWPWFSGWARKVEKAARREINVPSGDDMVIHIVSSDGRAEKKAQDAVLADQRKGVLGKVIVGGHSNGARDALRTCQLFYPEIEVGYAFCIDMTLAENGCLAFGNIHILDEFWAALNINEVKRDGGRVDFHPSFKLKKRAYNFMDLPKLTGRNISHIGSASEPIVTARIVGMIETVIER